MEVVIEAGAHEVNTGKGVSVVIAPNAVTLAVLLPAIKALTKRSPA